MKTGSQEHHLFVMSEFEIKQPNVTHQKAE
jgi:hypothetical protein